MKRRWICVSLALCLLPGLLLGGCGGAARYATSFFGVFDTVVELTAYAGSQREFSAFAQSAQERFIQLHHLFDKYNDSPHGNNLKTINDRAGIEPVAVDAAIIQLLLRCKQVYVLSGGAMNIALGPVLELWHDAREEGILPNGQALRAAALLCDIDDVIVDEAAGTVFLAKRGMSLDLGSAAKGFAVELVARELENGPVKNFLINAGGNVALRGRPQDPPGRLWGIGLEHPRAGEVGQQLIDRLYIGGGSVVTSGDYQRFMMVEGVRYAHIIDPATLQPALLYQAVTVIAGDSGDADMFSTALFILPFEEGAALAAAQGFEAVWVLADGQVRFTPGAGEMLMSQGAGP